MITTSKKYNPDFVDKQLYVILIYVNYISWYSCSCYLIMDAAVCTRVLHWLWAAPKILHDELVVFCEDGGGTWWMVAVWACVETFPLAITLYRHPVFDLYITHAKKRNRIIM